MFEIPNAKRVRRDELYDSSSDASDNNSQDGAEDAELRARLNKQLSKLLGLDHPAPAPPTAHEAEPAGHVQMHGGAAEEEEEREGGKHEEEFEFRLFSTTSGTAAPTRVVLSNSDDEGERGDGAFLVPARPAAYYVAGDAKPEQREGYQQAAVTAEEILAGAGRRAWGLERPWRVVRVTVSSGRAPNGSRGAVGAAPVVVGDDQVDEGGKRKRPGKKRRIAMRIKSKAEKAREEQKMTKEEHLKEKRKRLNREKKLKRKAKERQQRLAAKANGEGGEEGEGTEAEDSDTDGSAE